MKTLCLSCLEKSDSPLWKKAIESYLDGEYMRCPVCNDIVAKVEFEEYSGY